MSALVLWLQCGAVVAALLLLLLHFEVLPFIGDEKQQARLKEIYDAKHAAPFLFLTAMIVTSFLIWPLLVVAILIDTIQRLCK